MISEIPGFRVGHWTDAAAGTGCTVILPPPGNVAAADVRGGGASSRETELLRPLAGVRSATALLFTGGSAFGLDAATGVMRWCERHGLGYATVVAPVPVVPAAVIFDLGVTGGAARPDADAGEGACEAAAEGPHARGSVGAGTGATVGKLRAREGWCKGGLGASAAWLHDGTRVAALAVANCWGDVLAEDGTVLAGAWSAEEGFVGAARAAYERPPEHPRLAGPESTTLLCVATDAGLDAAEAGQVARMAQSGLARAIAPVNTPVDGDAVFCLAGGGRAASAFAVGAAAAQVAAEAVRDAVRRATSVRGVPTAAERRASSGSD